MAEDEFSESPCESSFPEGTLLGHYRLEWFIARSTTGELYSAIDVDNGKSCYLNIVSPSLTRHASDLAVRLLRKGQEVCLFRHKNLVSVLDTFSFEGGHCIVTECFSGEFAAERLLRGALPEEQVLDIAKQLALLLAEAEAKNVAGFVPDFTPESLILGNRGEVRIFYPGLNRLLPLFPGEILAEEKRFLAGVPFIAPELLVDKAPPAMSSAIYSLGMLLAVCLCGTVPRKSANAVSAMANTLNYRSCDISGYAPHVSPRTVALINAMTAKDPDDRMTLPQLLKAVGDKGVSFRTLRLAALSAAGLLLLGAAGAGLFFMLRSKSHQSEELLSNLEQFPASVQKSVPAAPETQNKNTPAPAKKVEPAAPETQTESPASPRQVESAAPQAVSPEKGEKKILLHKRGVPHFFKSVEEQLRFCRLRVQQLESELEAGLVAKEQVSLIRRRIDFRKAQILALSARRDLMESRRNGAKINKNPLRNARVKREVELKLASFTDRNMIFSHRALARRGEEKWMNEELFRTDVDYTMPISLPKAVQEYLGLPMAGSQKFRSLGLLLLDGILLPEAAGAKILARAEAPLEGLQHRHIITAFRQGQLDKNTLRYLVRELKAEHFKHFPLLAMNNSGVQNTFLEEFLREFLLNGGFPGSMALNMAVSAENPSPAVVRLLLEAEVPLEFSLRDRVTPLGCAYMNGVPEIVQLLLEAGADSEKVDSFGKKPRDYESYGVLALAIRNNDLQMALKAIKAGADVNLYNFKGFTPLIEAVRRNQPAMAQLLLENGADPNKYARNGSSVLQFLYVLYGNGQFNYEMLRVLAKNGADFSKLLFNHRNGSTLMKQICMFSPHALGAAEAAEVLLDTGKVETPPAYLLHVCNVKAIPLFRVLVKKWPDLNTPELKELLPNAMQKRMPADILRTLVERSAKNGGEKELLKAIRENPDVRVRSLLEEKKSDEDGFVPIPERQEFTDRLGVHVFDSELREKVSRAILREDRTELEALLKKGLSPDANIDGKTLLESAVLRNSVPLISLLLKYKADPYRGADTPLVLAVKEGKTVAFSALIKAVQPDRNTCFDLIWQIMRKDDAVSYLRPCFEQHGKRLRSFDFCILTEALKAMAPEQVLVECINFYKRFEAPKHRAVIHQALASRYRTAVIRILLTRGADAKGQAQILLRPNKKTGGKLYRVSALRAAEMVKAPRATMMLLRQYGAK